MPDIFNVNNRDPVMALTTRYGVPAIYFAATYFAKSGGLICYGTDFAEHFQFATVNRPGFSTSAAPAQPPTRGSARAS